MKRLMLAAAVLIGASALAAGPAAVLRVHLPETITVREPALRLGNVCVPACDDAALLQQAQQVELGRAPLAGEKLVVDRRTILSRLATAGIHANRVQITGAPAVSVSRDEQVFPAEGVLKAAEEYLGANRPGPAGCGWRLVRRPDALVAPRGDHLQLSARLSDEAALGLLRVEVAVMDGDQKVAATCADFKLSYPTRQAVATCEILPGTALSDQNVRLEDVMSERPADPNWASPVGLIASGRIARGAVISAGMFVRPQPRMLVRRNQGVTMRIEGFAFVLSMSGICLQDGRCGDVVRVRNADSQRVVSAQVMPDGSVRPLFEEVAR